MTATDRQAGSPDALLTQDTQLGSFEQQKKASPVELLRSSRGSDFYAPERTCAARPPGNRITSLSRPAPHMLVTCALELASPCRSWWRSLAVVVRAKTRAPAAQVDRQGPVVSQAPTVPAQRLRLASRALSRDRRWALLLLSAAGATIHGRGAEPRRSAVMAPGPSCDRLPIAPIRCLYLPHAR